MDNIHSNEPYWRYYTSWINNPDNVYLELKKEAIKKAEEITFKIYGKECKSNKISCVFCTDPENLQANARSGGFSYADLPKYTWEDAPESIRSIKKEIEQIMRDEYNDERELSYVLMHLYRDHNDNLGYHADKEVKDTAYVCSISLGAPRRIRFKENKSKEVSNITMNSGDMLIMNPICQKEYKHQIPKMTIKEIKEFINNNIEEEIKITRNNVEDIVENLGIDMGRINLTFRHLEE